MRRLVAGAACLVVALSACADDALPPVIAGGAPPSDACGAQVMPALQQGSHLIGDTPPPVPYTSVPPTSGWHRSGAPRRGVVEEPLSDPEVVSALEAGDVVVAYDPARVPDATIQRLAELTTTTFRDRVTLTPYAPMPSPIAFVGWTVLRPCDDLDEAALSAFVLAWYGAASIEH